jgi:hypothetical protein
MLCNLAETSRIAEVRTNVQVGQYLTAICLLAVHYLEHALPGFKIGQVNN